MKKNYQTLIGAEVDRVKKEIAAMFEERLSTYATRDATRPIKLRA